MNDYETLKAQNERANEYNRQLLARNVKLSKRVKSQKILLWVMAGFYILLLIIQKVF